MKHPNDPTLKSFIEVPPEHHFPIQNLPYGIFKPQGQPDLRVGIAIGDYILDLALLETEGLLKTSSPTPVFNQPKLNTFMALGFKAWQDIRLQISQLLRHDNPLLRDNSVLRARAIWQQNEVCLELPIAVADYTDFYSSQYHATNVGRLFRPQAEPLLPNWKQLPVAYNGRASSVVVSGTPLHRPWGQIQSGQAPAQLAPSACLDFELEMGFIVGTGNALNSPIKTADAQQHIFGMVLLNDWSARDIQRWESVPLGPFLSKAFGTSISPWVVPLAALEPFRIEGPQQVPEPLLYLQQTGKQHFDIQLQVHLRTAKTSTPLQLCFSNHKYLYWSIDQQLAHHTLSGCNTRTGDLMGSGTISGPTPDSLGCLLELTQNGQTGHFLNDFDEISMTGWCQGAGYRIGFGEVTGKILPANPKP